MKINNKKKKGSSETTRKIRFQRKILKKARKNSTFQFEAYFKTGGYCNPSCGFLEWFIGFFEAEGTFAHWFDGEKQRCQIEITQKDPKLMYKIKKKFGFGNVTYFLKNNNTYWRYQISKTEHLQALIVLFNGNLVTEHKYQTFCLFLNQFYHCSNQKPIFLLEKNNKVVSLTNYWLSGFLEGNGDFGATQKWNQNQSKLSSGLQIKFSIAQKQEHFLLNQIKNLFKISTQMYSIYNEHNDILYNCLETTHIDSLKIIRMYLERYPFLGQRTVLIKRWIRLIGYKEKDYPLTEKSSRKLTRLVLATKQKSLLSLKS